MRSRGRIVSDLVNGAQAAGIHVIEWDGRTAIGIAPAGIYFVSITTDEWSARSKIVRL